MISDPMFLRFINKESTVIDLLNSFSRSPDQLTRDTATKMLESGQIPNLDEFHKELEDAVTDIIKVGIGDEFKAFVNYYMQDSITEDLKLSDSLYGENVSCFVRIKDPSSTWIEGFICYNLCLYIKAYGLEALKKCKICGRLFAHKGKYAVYCSDQCKAMGKKSV